MPPKKTYTIRKSTLNNTYSSYVELPVAIVDYEPPKKLDGVTVSQLTISRINADAARQMASRVVFHNYFVAADNHPVMVRLIPTTSTSMRYVADFVGDARHAHGDLKDEAERLLNGPELADFATLPKNDENKLMYAPVAAQRNLPPLDLLNR
jgi:hypothetical protein